MLKVSQRILYFVLVSCFVSCGHDEAYYSKAWSKLLDASYRQHMATNAACLDANNHAAVAMLKEINRTMEAKNKVLEDELKTGRSSKMSQKERYERDLKAYNDINVIIRTYGFEKYAMDFDPDK